MCRAEKVEENLDSWGCARAPVPDESLTIETSDNRVRDLERNGKKKTNDGSCENQMVWLGMSENARLTRVQGQRGCKVNE